MAGSSCRPETHGNEIWVTVTDSGIGLTRDQMERIFERFYQVEDHMTRTKGGLGIGLSIARAMIEAHNGRIWASQRRSEPGVDLHDHAAMVTE